jgi:glucokinase
MSMTTTIGIDLGGSKIAAGVVAVDNRVHDLTVRDTPREGPHHSLQAIRDVVEELDPAGTMPVGVAVPELVDHAGQLASHHTVAWTRSDLERALAPRLIAVDNDVHAAGYAEARVGGLTGTGFGVYLSLGTGLACSVIVGGRPLRGLNSFAGAPATSPLATVCEHCDHLTMLAVEDIATGAGIARRWADAPNEPQRTHEVFAAADEGDARARCLIHDSAVVLGSQAAYLVNLLDPQAVVVGGGLARASEAWWQQFERTMREHTYAAAMHPTVALSELWPAGGVIGAALAYRDPGL